MNKQEYIKCPICESDGIFFMNAKNTHGSHFISDEEFNLVKCEKCGLIFINPRPTEKEAIKYYDFNYYESKNTIKSKIEKLLLNHWPFFSKKYVINKFAKEGRILDIGCGNGNFLNSLQSDKWEIYGIEPNSAGYDLTRKKNITSSNIFNKKLLDCNFPDNYFDVITMWHVFEHVYYPKKELQEIKRILKNDGLFILTIPNIKSIGFRISKQNWFHLDAPRHLFHYDAETITKLLRDNIFDFDIIQIKYIYFDFPLDIYHSLLRTFDKNINKFTKILIKISLLFCLPLLKLIGSLFHSSETILIVCKK